jgi:hypothetical protein
MPRRIVEFELSLCVLIMFGTASVADDEVIFDLAHASVRQASAAPLPSEPVQVHTADDYSQYAAPSQPIVHPEMGLPPEAEPLLSADEPHGFFGWRRQPPHFDMPSRSYSLFRSPASYGWGFQERCAPTPWKPRGDGIPRRTSCYRMDYAPYQLEHDSSKHGPAFYMRYELYPCPECHKHACHLQRFYGPQH